MRPAEGMPVDRGRAGRRLQVPPLPGRGLGHLQASSLPGRQFGHQAGTAAACKYQLYLDVREVTCKYHLYLDINSVTKRGGGGLQVPSVPGCKRHQRGRPASIISTRMRAVGDRRTGGRPPAGGGPSGLSTLGGNPVQGLRMSSAGLRAGLPGRRPGPSVEGGASAWGRGGRLWPVSRPLRVDKVRGEVANIGRWRSDYDRWIGRRSALGKCNAYSCGESGVGTYVGGRACR